MLSQWLLSRIVIDPVSVSGAGEPFLCLLHPDIQRSWSKKPEMNWEACCVGSFRHHRVYNVRHTKHLCFTYMAAVDKLVCVYVALLWSRATWVCQHPARCSPRTRGCGGAGSCWHGRPVQRDGAGDVGRRHNRAVFVLPSAEPGKTSEPPVSACTSRQGGKWTYRCCTVPLRLWSVMCLVGRGWTMCHIYPNDS